MEQPCKLPLSSSPHRDLFPTDPHVILEHDRAFPALAFIHHQSSFQIFEFLHGHISQVSVEFALTFDVSEYLQRFVRNESVEIGDDLFNVLWGVVLAHAEVTLGPHLIGVNIKDSLRLTSADTKIIMMPMPRPKKSKKELLSVMKFFHCTPTMDKEIKTKLEEIRLEWVGASEADVLRKAVEEFVKR